LARPNFKYEKRQKELAKQKKAEEKRLRKLEKRGDATDETSTEEVSEESSAEQVVEGSSEASTNDAPAE